jgi:methylase of polypeptide subunit release factors
MAFSDGLHTGEGRLLTSKLDLKWASRLSSCRAIGVETIAARVGGQEQLDMYRLMMENVWAMVQEGFSERVVQVGKTTAEDLEWWFRDVMRWRVSRTRDTVEANRVLRDEVADY